MIALVSGSVLVASAYPIVTSASVARIPPWIVPRALQCLVSTRKSDDQVRAFAPAVEGADQVEDRAGPEERGKSGRRIHWRQRSGRYLRSTSIVRQVQVTWPSLADAYSAKRLPGWISRNVTTSLFSAGS